MDSPLRMRKEWPFQMYPKRSSPTTLDFRARSDLGRQSCQRTHRLIPGRGDGCRKIRPDTAGCKISPDCTERLRRCFHHVVSRTAMNVDIDIGRNQRGLGKAMRCVDAFVLTCRKTLDTNDAIVFYRYKRIFHHSARTHQSPPRYGTGHPALSLVPLGERRFS